MREDIKLTFLSIAGLIIIVFMSLACGGGGGSGGDSEGQSIEETNANDVAVHLNASRYASSECIKCHGNMQDQTTLDSSVEGIHPKHTRVTTLTCTDCHQSVDLLQKSGANLRRQVDVQKCVDCHGTTLYQGA